MVGVGMKVTAIAITLIVSPVRYSLRVDGVSRMKDIGIIAVRELVQVLLMEIVFHQHGIGLLALAPINEPSFYQASYL